MGLLVRLELLFPVQVNGQGRHFHEWLARGPILGTQCFAILNDDFPSQGKISIEPGSPQATTISHHIQLMESEGLLLAAGGDFGDWRVGVTSNDLEGGDWLFNDLSSTQEGTNGGPIASEVVSFASLKIPLCCFFELSEPIESEEVLAVVDCMEVGG